MVLYHPTGVCQGSNEPPAWHRVSPNICPLGAAMGAAMAGVRAPPTARQAITALPVPATAVSPYGRGMDTFPPAPCTRWDVARCGEHSPGAVQLPLPTTSQVPAPLTHRSPAVLGESLRFHGHDLKLRRGALQQEAARSGLTRSGSPRRSISPPCIPQQLWLSALTLGDFRASASGWALPGAARVELGLGPAAVRGEKRDP